MRVLITGGAGFVGSNLAFALQARHPGAELLIVDDLRCGTRANLGLGISCKQRSAPYRGELIQSNLADLDPAELLDDFKPGTVFHLASITDTRIDDDALMTRDNVEPFEKLLAACVARKAKLVWASSAATYGTDANGATAARRRFALEDAGAPANAYGREKWAMENLHRRALTRHPGACLLYTSPSPRDQRGSRMPSSA